MHEYNLTETQRSLLTKIVEAYKEGKVADWGILIQLPSTEHYGKHESYIDWGEFSIDINDEMDIEELVDNGLLRDRYTLKGKRQFQITNYGIDAVENDFKFEDNRMRYNLTDSQKELLRKLVEGNRKENWGIAFMDASGEIISVCYHLVKMAHN